MTNDNHEIEKFNSLAHEWWNMDGEFRTLHQINPIRLNFVNKHVDLKDKYLIDVGCGGGIFSEALAKEEAKVDAIDLAAHSIEVAKLHLYESHLNINYECIDIQAKAEKNVNQFDVLTCMEMLEHVSNPNVIIKECHKLLKSGGYAFFSTINRNIKSYLFGIIAAEYILNLIPRGTHEYKKLIKPSELRTILVKNGFQLIDIKGIEYNPFTQKAKLTNNIDINYIICCKKND